MTLPTQTWRVSQSYPFTPVGASATVTEILAAINAMLVAEVAFGSYWGVSDYSAGNGTLEIKRRGSPTGVLATFRQLIFGGASPNAAALANGVTAGATNLYAGCAEDANTTGPIGAYTAGNPYTGKRWSGGSCCGSGATVVKTENPYVFMIESDECCAIFINCNSISHSTIFGAIAERLSDNSRVWSSANSGATAINVADMNSLSTTNPWFFGALTSATIAQYPVTVWHDGVAQRALSRLLISGLPGDPNYLVNLGILSPIILADRLSTETVMKPLGVARQMRFGPNCINKIGVYDGSAVLQAYGVSSGYNLVRVGMYFDTVP